MEDNHKNAFQPKVGWKAIVDYLTNSVDTSVFSCVMLCVSESVVKTKNRMNAIKRGGILYLFVKTCQVIDRWATKTRFEVQVGASFQL